MKKKWMLSALSGLMALQPGAQTTLEQCQQAAMQNYPLIKQYDLISKTTDLTVKNIGKAWLPQVNATAQATLQSDVASWPEKMRTMLDQMGIAVKGLKKDQYRIGLDVNQTVYDGGTISRQKEVARRQGDVQKAQTEVTLYNVRSRVNDMYYGLLLLDDQLKLKSDLCRLLESNEKKLASLYKRGAAAECDYLAVKAERLNVEQQLTDLRSQRETLAGMLSMFCGLEVNDVIMPTVAEATQAAENNRPELRLADTQLRLADAQERLLNAQLMPKVSVFAQGYYGYPGYNMFEDMMSHEWSLNAMVGARLTWNIGALYTRKNDKAKLAVSRATVLNNRDVFLFNNQLEQTQHNRDIQRLQQMMQTDDEIINVRAQVRKSAESKLAHGIIAVNDLIKEINAENASRVQQSIHRIEYLKAISDLQTSINQ